jgi:hypothetical protein
MNDKIQKTDGSSIMVTPVSGPVAMASAAGAKPSDLKEMWELQLQYEANEARKAFNVAISGFMSECPIIKKTREAYSSKYAGLAETIEKIKPIMSKYGLSHRWNTAQDAQNISVKCTVSHCDGHSESTTLSATADKTGNKNSIQAIGSTVSYLQRYTLFSILGLASTDQDDDGNAAEEKPTNYINESQLADISALIDELGVNEKAFCAHIGVSCLEEIHEAKYKSAINQLERKRKVVEK